MKIFVYGKKLYQQIVAEDERRESIRIARERVIDAMQERRDKEYYIHLEYVKKANADMAAQNDEIIRLLNDIRLSFIGRRI